MGLVGRRQSETSLSNVNIRGASGQREENPGRHLLVTLRPAGWVWLTSCRNVRVTCRAAHCRLIASFRHSAAQHESAALCPPVLCQASCEAQGI